MRCSLKKTNLKLAIFQCNEIKYVIFKKEKWCVQHPAAGGSCQRVEQLSTMHSRQVSWQKGKLIPRSRCFGLHTFCLSWGLLLRKLITVQKCLSIWFFREKSFSHLVKLDWKLLETFLHRTLYFNVMKTAFNWLTEDMCLKMIFFVYSCLF